jgi:hypothetical protein
MAATGGSTAVAVFNGHSTASCLLWDFDGTCKNSPGLANRRGFLSTTTDCIRSLPSPFQTGSFLLHRVTVGCTGVVSDT